VYVSARRGFKPPREAARPTPPPSHVTRGIIFKKQNKKTKEKKRKRKKEQVEHGCFPRKLFSVTQASDQMLIGGRKSTASHKKIFLLREARRLGEDPLRLQHQQHYDWTSSSLHTKNKILFHKSLNQAKNCHSYNNIIQYSTRPFLTMATTLYSSSNNILYIYELCY